MMEMVSEVTLKTLSWANLGPFQDDLGPFQDDLGPICKPELKIVAD